MLSSFLRFCERILFAFTYDYNCFPIRKYCNNKNVSHIPTKVFLVFNIKFGLMVMLYNIAVPITFLTVVVIKR